MRAYDVIRKKRDGEALGREEIAFLMRGAAGGEVPDYQLSAFLMAVFQKGMTAEETAWLTEAMMRSGRAFDFKGLTGPVVDKHSTGGVGDKTSIILAPLLASMGIKVPMVSGRALGHTGGTLDKLESIPGLRTDIPVEEAARNLKDIGFFMMGQTEDLAPADRKLYALRDVTATVESVPLIASSIMSKKLAEGIDGLVLDVKCGRGAFMKGIGDARELAHAMVSIGNSMGVKTVALITDMDQPLGRTVGNSLEIKECITALRGRGARDLMDLAITLSAWMLNVSDAISAETEPVKLDKFALMKYQQESLDFIGKGDAFKKFVEFIDAQHGDPEAAFKINLLPSASITKPITAGKDGYIRRLDAGAVGRAAMLLGAGREKAEDAVNPAAGIVLNRKTGDQVRAGEPVAMFHLDDEKLFREAEEVFLSGLEIGDRDAAVRPLVLDVVTGGP
jgi:pyrimidine-nucleoside phosphorylase